MANRLYPKGRQKFLEGSIAWLTDDIRVVLLSATYVYSDAHEFHSSLTGIVATSGNLTGKTSTAGIADAADVTFPTVAAGPPVTQVVVYKWTGVSGTSPLIAYWDSDAAAVLLTVTPDGTDMVLTWSNGSLKMFRL
jgi:hypothetical protein